jgi:hypothetical protein
LIKQRWQQIPQGQQQQGQLLLVDVGLKGLSQDFPGTAWRSIGLGFHGRELLGLLQTQRD